RTSHSARSSWPRRPSCVLGCWRGYRQLRRPTNSGSGGIPHSDTVTVALLPGSTSLVAGWLRQPWRCPATASGAACACGPGARGAGAAAGATYWFVRRSADPEGRPPGRGLQCLVAAELRRDGVLAVPLDVLERHLGDALLVELA